MTPQSHEDRLHARFAPSAAARWMACHGSVAASEGVPEGKPSSYALDGTACHEAAAAILQGAIPVMACKDLTDEQMDLVLDYTDYSFNRIDTIRDKFPILDFWVEQQVRAPNISPDYYGTADLALFASKTLEIVDLKTGYVPVRVENNKQLLSYALLTMWEHDLWHKVRTIRMTIVQPRVYDEPQTWAIGIDRLDEFQEEVAEAIYNINNGSAELNAGDHCKYCPAKGKCPALHKLVIDKAKIAFDTAGEKLHRFYNVDELSEIAQEAMIIQAHIDGVLQQIRRELEKGRRVPGWKLVKKRAVSKWNDFGELANLLLYCGIEGDDVYHYRPKTPKQLQAVLKKAKVDFDLAPYFIKESSGLTLAPDDDPREAERHDPFTEGK